MIVSRLFSVSVRCLRSRRSCLSYFFTTDSKLGSGSKFLIGGGRVGLKGSCSGAGTSGCLAALVSSLTLAVGAVMGVNSSPTESDRVSEVSEWAQHISVSPGTFLWS